MKLPAAILAMLTAFAMNAQNDFSGHTVYANGGASLITTEFDESWTYGESRIGGNWQVGYEWISAKNIGVGLMYDGYLSKGTIIAPSGEFKESFTLHYIAPQFAGRITLKSEKWNLNYSAGLGLTVFADRLRQKQAKSFKPIGANYDYGIGINVSLSVEYHITQKIGATAGLSLINSYIKQEYLGENLVNNDSGISGIGRINIDLGLRYHF